MLGLRKVSVVDILELDNGYWNWMMQMGVINVIGFA